MIRKIVTIVEEVHKEGLKEVKPPIRKAAAIAVIKNPYAGEYKEDLTLLLREYGGKLGTLLARKAVEALGIPPEKVHSFGKASIVGINGELEHGSAILHENGSPSFGFNFRKEVGGGKASIRSTEKRGGVGAHIDVPLCYKNAERVRSHFDSFEVGVYDAPMPDEIVIVAVISDGGRPLARIGGLQIEQVKGEDGLI